MRLANLEKVALCDFLGRGQVLVKGWIAAVPLATLLVIRHDFPSLLDAFEKAVVLALARGGRGSLFLVWVVEQDLASVGILDVQLGGLPALGRQTEDL